MFPNFALQSALSETAGVKTIHVGPHSKETIEVSGVCTVTVNEN